MNVLFQALGHAAFPCIATLIAGLVALRKTPGEKAQGFIQHFAAGVVLSAAAGEILPEIKASHSAFELIVGFAGGVFAMLVIRALSERGNESEGKKSPTSLLITVAIDIFLDGALIGLGFAAGQKTGLLLTVALTLELMFLGLSTSTTLLRNGVSKGRVMLNLAALCVLLLMGTGVGAGLLGLLPHSGLVIALSFGLAALLFLVVEELLVEAHEVKETAWSSASFFAGFLCLTVIEMST
ncbi:MAG: transporter [Deltaproteobacteria bacterium]|nr:transporter [Deltaproteobacteria bacterium]